VCVCVCVCVYTLHGTVPRRIPRKWLLCQVFKIWRAQNIKQLYGF